MSNTNFLDLLTTLGRETCQVLGPVVGHDDIVPNDACDLFIPVCGEDFGGERLRSLSQKDLQAIRDFGRRYFECSEIEVDHIREIASRTAAHWS